MFENIKKFIAPEEKSSFTVSSDKKPKIENENKTQATIETMDIVESPEWKEAMDDLFKSMEKVDAAEGISTQIKTLNGLQFFKDNVDTVISRNDSDKATSLLYNQLRGIEKTRNKINELYEKAVNRRLDYKNIDIPVENKKIIAALESNIEDIEIAQNNINQLLNYIEEKIKKLVMDSYEDN